MLAKRRERFIADIDEQDASVQEKVMLAWVKLLGGEGNWIPVARDMVKAFRSLQVLERIRTQARL
jgi:hypothetical protein